MLRKVFLLLIMVLIGDFSSFADSEWGDFQNLLQELHEPASVAFVSDDQKNAFEREAGLASWIVSAKLEGVSIESMGISSAMISMTRIQLSEIALYKGEEIKDKALLYEGLPDPFVDLQKKRVIVFLEEAKNKQTVRVLKIEKASDWKLAILKQLLPQKEEDCDKPAVPVCDVEV